MPLCKTHNLSSAPSKRSTSFLSNGIVSSCFFQQHHFIPSFKKLQFNFHFHFVYRNPTVRVLDKILGHVFSEIKRKGKKNERGKRKKRIQLHELRIFFERDQESFFKFRYTFFIFRSQEARRG